MIITELIYQEYLKILACDRRKFLLKYNITERNFYAYMKENNLPTKRKLSSQNKKNQNKNRLLIKKPNWISESEKENIKILYKSGFSTIEISKLYRKNRETIAKILFREFSIEKHDRRKWRVFDDFFDNIDSEIKVYLLGFFVADGCVSFDNRFTFNNAIADTEIISLYKEYIAFDSPLVFKENLDLTINRQTQICIRWNSKHMKNSLFELYNITPNKTYTSYNLPNIDKNMLRHFVRGFFDGDGCISITGNNRHICKQGALSFAITNEIFANDLCNYFKSVDLDTKVTKRNSKSGFIMYSTSFYHKDNLRKIFELFYKDSNFYLKRKYNKFIEILEIDNTELNLETKESKSV